MATDHDDKTISALNELLRGELSAVETYNQAIGVLAGNSEVASELRECQTSHQDRVSRLRAQVLERGGQPADSSGAWGMFAKLVEGGATVVGPKAAINALEAGEDHGLKEYREALDKLDVAARNVVSAEIYPKQIRTHAIMSALKKTPGAPPPMATVG